MNFRRIISGLLALLLAIGLSIVLTSAPASAIDSSGRRHCNKHHTTMESGWGQDIHVFIEGQPDFLQTSGHTYFGVGYWLCRLPGVGTFEQPRWIGACYTHTGIIPSIVLQGINTDYIGATSSKRLHEVDNIFTQTHPPVVKGDSYCEQKWFISRKWVKRSALYRWRVNYWEVTSNHADQHHESPAIFLDPKNDRQLTPFRTTR